VNARELRELTDEELSQRLRESSESLFSLRVQAVTGELDDSHAVRRHFDSAEVPCLIA